MADKQELETRGEQSAAEVGSRIGVDTVAPDADVI